MNEDEEILWQALRKIPDSAPFSPQKQGEYTRGLMEHCGVQPCLRTLSMPKSKESMQASRFILVCARVLISHRVVSFRHGHATTSPQEAPSRNFMGKILFPFRNLRANRHAPRPYTLSSRIWAWGLSLFALPSALGLFRA